MYEHDLNTALSIQQVQDRLRAWIADNTPGAPQVAGDTDIIESRIVDSLQFVNFMLFVEELRGEPIPPEELAMEKFATLDAICANYFVQS